MNLTVPPPPIVTWLAIALPQSPLTYKRDVAASLKVKVLPELTVIFKLLSSYNSTTVPDALPKVKSSATVFFQFEPGLSLYDG